MSVCIMDIGETCGTYYMHDHFPPFRLGGGFLRVRLERLGDAEVLAEPVVHGFRGLLDLLITLGGYFMRVWPVGSR